MKITAITPVNNLSEYKRNVQRTLIADQFLPIENAKSAAAALNQGLEQAENDICVLCHQDVSFPAELLRMLDVKKLQGGKQAFQKLQEEYVFKYDEPHKEQTKRKKPKENLKKDSTKN